MLNLNFKAKLILFVGALLAGLQAINFFAVSDSTTDTLLEHATGDLKVAQITAERYIENTAMLAARTSEVSLRDYTVKRYLVNGDPGTKTSVVYNVIQRVKADWSVYLTLDLEAEITTYLSPIEDYQTFPFISLIDSAEAAPDGTAYGIGLINGKAHLMSVVAVDAPKTIGYFVGGFQIDEAFLTDISAQLPNVRAALIATSTNRIVASKLESAITKDLLSSLMSDEQTNALSKATSHDEQFAVAILDLPSTGTPETDVALFLSYSLDAALNRERSIFYSLAGLLGGALLIAVLGAIFFASELSKPIIALSTLAKKVQDGDYSSVPVIKSKDEFGKLTKSFETMIHRVKTREAELFYRIHHDVDTGLMNRHEFLVQLEKQLEREPATYHVTVIRVSTLDQVNYVLGSDIAHDATAMFAERLKNFPQGTLCARLGDNLFAVAYYQDKMDLVGLEERLRTPIIHEDYEIEIDYRRGNSINTPDITPADGLQRAWAALYRAVETGPQITSYDPKQDEPNADSLTMMGEMRRGLQTDEFELYVQPKIDLKTRKTIEAEGLIRWFHETRGFVPPDNFIPIAEKTGKVRLITNWVLKRGCEMVRDWRSKEIGARLAINLSVKDLTDQTLPSRLMVLIRRYKLTPNDLAIEITESALMADPETALKVLHRLKEAGFHMSIDDFGTGYSSLEYLRNLPVNEIKIDRSFVQNIAENKSDQIIVKATIELAHGLNMTVTAEGVEDEESLNILTELGCDTAQGYHIARPLAQSDFEHFMKTHTFGSGPSLKESINRAASQR
jgi:EAL domain-containing protein (putative c-di-GMP-specific phosphodiesterase class I)/HAMP domain-containing protein